MKFGIVGYGSVGQRHVKNLISLGYDDITLFRSISAGNEYSLKEFNNYTEFLNNDFDGIIISNPTSLHAKYLYPILERNLNVMVEKPVVSTQKQYQLVKDYLRNYSGISMTAYNMRFHPCIIELNKILIENLLGQLFSARFFVGQYLPDWVPKRDYSKSYSAKREMGGGVIFDLIHEIDLAVHLIGKPHGKILSKIGFLSNLKINTEDLAEILYSTDDQRFVSIHLDYLSPIYKRYIEIIGEKGTLHIDLYINEINIFLRGQKVRKKSFHNISKNEMYINLISNFIKCIKNNEMSTISLKKGLLSNQIALRIKGEKN